MNDSFPMLSIWLITLRSECHIKLFDVEDVTLHVFDEPFFTKYILPGHVLAAGSFKVRCDVEPTTVDISMIQSFTEAL